eukprot:SAG22_NODE_3163_length_1888_cov_1.853549_3_plen_252_part_00
MLPHCWLAPPSQDPSTVQLLDQLGNTYCNSLWESSLEVGTKPARSSAEYIKAKYNMRMHVRQQQQAEQRRPAALVEAAAANDARGCMECLVLGQCGSNLEAALCAAVHGDALATAELLLNCGASVERSGGGGEAATTVLHFGVVGGSPAMLRLLLGRGAGACVNMPAAAAVETSKEDGLALPAEFVGLTPLQIGEALATAAAAAPAADNREPSTAAQCLGLLRAAAEKQAERAAEHRDAEASRSYERAEQL